MGQIFQHIQYFTDPSTEAGEDHDLSKTGHSGTFPFNSPLLLRQLPTPQEVQSQVLLLMLDINASVISIAYNYSILASYYSRLQLD